MKYQMLRLSKVLVILFLFSSVPLIGQNLITHGNFDDDILDFETDYVHAYGLGGDGDVGKYWLGANARDHSSSMFIFYDHTTGTGQQRYMIVNGATQSNRIVWGMNLPVTPHSYYTFTLWMTNLSAGGGTFSWMKPRLKILINNQTVVDNYEMPNVYSSQGYWNQLPFVWWYSGSATTAHIQIIDLCTADNGNDFGLDDIAFNFQYSNVVTAVNDAVTTCFEQPVNFDPFANDVVSPENIRPDVDCSIYTMPSHGSLDWFYGTTWIYTPDIGFSGTDQLTYKLTYGTNDIVEYGTVTFTVNPRPQRVIEQHACESFTWSYTGETYTQNGQYSYVKPVPNGCDSLLVLNLTIHHGDEMTLPAVEECDSYTWHGTTYTQSGIYDHTTTTEWGCVRIEHLPLTIHYSDTVDYNISACETYTWHGQTYTSSGVYSYNTTNNYGCNRLERLNLTITDRYHENIPVEECDQYTWPRNGQTYFASAIDSISVQGPPNGCDSTFVLNLTIHYSDTLTLDPVSACDSYEWHGQTYTTSGLKEYATTNSFGCDRLELLNLTIHNSENIELPSVTQCDTYQWHGQTYTQSGIIVFDTINQYGCAVQYTLPLTINHSDTLNWDPVTECDSYLWYGQTITESGQYSHYSTTPEGCDRLERIYVTINHSSIDTLAPVTACDSYEWHGQEYTRTGYYTYVEEGPTGCPHTEVLLLTINHSSQKDLYVTACESYTWYDSTYTDPGTYYHVIENSQGCDSLLIMHLEIGQTFEMEETAIGCESYEWHGNVYTTDGDYEFPIENPDGCDSLFILHLTIEPNYEQEVEAVECYSYTWIDQVYQESGDYLRHFVATTGCDSLVILHLTINDAVHHEFEQQTCLPFTWNGITYYEDGDYEQTFEAHNGCDSIATMHLVFSDAITTQFDRTACGPIQWEEHVCDHEGNYVHTYESIQGCDSIVTMHFSLTEQIVREFDTLACEPFTWFNYECNHDGMTCQHVFQTPFGCDSVVTMHVYLNTFEINTQFIGACDSYLCPFNGVLYDEPGVYIIDEDTILNQYGCDSIVMRLRLEVKDSNQIGIIQGNHNVYVASNMINGIYRYEVNPDEVQGDIEWSLSNPDWQIVENQDNYCLVFVGSPGMTTLTASFATPECGLIERSFDIVAGFFGVGDHQSVEAKVYPNPTQGTVTIEAEGLESIRLTNIMGQVLLLRECDRSDSLVLDLSGYAPSIYLIEIKTTNGTTNKRVTLCR